MLKTLFPFASVREAVLDGSGVTILLVNVLLGGY